MHLAESQLDRSTLPVAGAPFINETTDLLRAVNDRDFDALLAMGDEDFSTIEVDSVGGRTRVRTLPDWAPRLRRFFVLVEALNATTDSEITGYRAVETSELGYSVVEFRQDVVGAAFIATFDCVATIIWRPSDDGWQEACWHCSVVDRQVVLPEPIDGQDSPTDHRADRGQNA